MKNYIFTCMVLLLIAFSTSISPLDKVTSFHSMDELTISSSDIISNSEVIIGSVTTIVEKVHSKSLPPSNDNSHDYKVLHLPFRFISHEDLPEDSSGFINVIQTHSNYLSL